MAVNRARSIDLGWPWALGGAAATLLLWLVVVPWDLSEVEKFRPVPSYDYYGGSSRSGDDYGFQIGVVLAVVVVLAVAFILAGRTSARWSATAGAATWAVRFTWRAAVARTSGANMWMAGFVIVIAPAAVVVHFAVHAVACWRSGRAGDTSDRTRDGEPTAE